MTLCIHIYNVIYTFVSIYIMLYIQRSNQINIAMTSLPPVSKIRSIIMEMKEDLISRDAIEKLQLLLPHDEEVSMIKQAFS